MIVIKTFTVPVPIFSREMEVKAYCFRFQKDDTLSLLKGVSSFDGTVNSEMLELIDTVGLDALTTGKPIFVPISQIALFADLEEQCKKEEPKNIVFVLDKYIAPEPHFIGRINRFKELGYKFACYSKMDLKYHGPIIKLCDYIFMNVDVIRAKNSGAYLKAISEGAEIIVSNIDTAETFSQVKYMDFGLFEGLFYRLPMTRGQTSVSPLKVNYIQLLNLVRDENFELETVARIVQQDAALAISLLKVVNSLGLKSRIKSIGHAAALLGQNELRKWITTAVTQMLSSDSPNEITKLSLVRAKFAENLAKKFELAIHAQQLFLMGLFSALDIILGMSMELALQLVKVSKQIEDALVRKSGPFHIVLEFVLFYESADWVGVTREMIINGLVADEVYNAYFEALMWYSGLISMDSEIPDEIGDMDEGIEDIAVSENMGASKP